MRMIFLESVDSTQALARREVAAGLAGRDGAVAFVARAQSAGVGQRGRAWSSPPGGLWMTLCVPVSRQPLGELGIRVGWSVLGLCRELVPERARARLKLKWPNDIMLDDRKLGGVLIESMAAAAGESADSGGAGVPTSGLSIVLAGVGVNLAMDPGALPPEIAGSAATLATVDRDGWEGPEIPEAEALAPRWAGVLTREIRASCRGGNEADPADRGGVLPPLAHIALDLWRLGERVTYCRADGSMVRGVIAGLGPTGGLLLEQGAERFELVSGSSALGSRD